MRAEIHVLARAAAGEIGKLFIFESLQRDPLLTYATNLYQYASSSPVMLTDPLGLYTLVEVLLIVVLIAIILAFGIVIYRKIYRPVKYRRLYPGEDLTLKVQLKNLIGCAQMAGNNALVANLKKMQIVGYLEDEYADEIGANALTQNGKTYISRNFLMKSLCQRYWTLIHEASRVGGNYTEEGQPGYEKMLSSEAKASGTLACCLRCCHDLPASLPPKWKKPDECCC